MPSGVLALVPALVSLRGRSRETEEHELRHARAALQPVSARVEQRHETLAAPRITRIPDRSVDRDAGAEQARSWTRESHKVGRQGYLLAVSDDVRAPVEMP